MTLERSSRLESGGIDVAQALERAMKPFWRGSWEGSWTIHNTPHCAPHWSAGIWSRRCVRPTP